MESKRSSTIRRENVRIKKIKKAVKEYVTESLFEDSVKERENEIAASECCSMEVVLEKGPPPPEKSKRKRK
jgi:hypothetical protein